MSIGERIKLARTNAGLSLRGLAERIAEADRVDGLGFTAIQKIEAGMRKVASHEVSEFAEVLGVSVGFLLGREERSSALRLAARATASVTGEELAGIAARAAQLLEAKDLLDRVEDHPPAMPRRPVIRPSGRGQMRTQGKALAEAARRELGLGTGPLGDLTGLVESRFGTIVSVEPLQSDHHGFSLVGGDDSVVLVNANDTYGRQRFTLAHELCHLILIDVDTWDVVGESSRGDPSEVRADAFAAHFLAPDDGLLAAIGGRVVDVTVVGELIHWFGMSLPAMLNRLVDVDAISDADKNWYTELGLRRISASAHMQEYIEARDALQSTTVPSRTLLDRALRAYSSGKLGLGIVADVFGSNELARVREWATSVVGEPQFDDVPSGAGIA